MAQGAGAALSNAVAGAIAHHYGFEQAFFALAAIAIAGLVFFTLFMPETRQESAEPAPEAALATAASSSRNEGTNGIPGFARPRGFPRQKTKGHGPSEYVSVDWRRQHGGFSLKFLTLTVLRYAG